MATLKSIRLKNVQVHTDTFIEDIPPVGIVTFYGENSDGKSVPVKVIHDIVSGRIREKEERYSLITWGKEFCECTLTRHDGAVLFAHISKQAAETYVTLFIGEESFTRYLRDGDYSDLVKQFGFHYDKERGVSLQIYETFDPMLFINTPPPTNYDVFVNCLTDVKVERSCEAYEVFKKAVESKSSEVRNAQLSLRSQLSTITVYNIEREAEYKNKFDYAQHNLTALSKCVKELPEMPKYSEKPTVDFDSMNALKKMLLPLPAIVEYKEKPVYDVETIQSLKSTLMALPAMPAFKHRPKISPQIEILQSLYKAYLPPDIVERGLRMNENDRALKEIRNKRCPTCGKGLI